MGDVLEGGSCDMEIGDRPCRCLAKRSIWSWRIHTRISIHTMCFVQCTPLTLSQSNSFGQAPVSGDQFWITEYKECPPCKKWGRVIWYCSDTVSLRTDEADGLEYLALLEAYKKAVATNNLRKERAAMEKMADFMKRISDTGSCKLDCSECKQV